MPRAKTTRRKLKPVSCPWCGKKICSETNVLQHINQPSGSCYQDFFLETLLGTGRNPTSSPELPTTEYRAEQSDTPPTTSNEDDFDMAHEPRIVPNPPGLNPSVPGCQPQRIGPDRFVEVFEGCAEQFPGGKTFMDEFRNDQYAEERRQNLYFPWASRREWAFASWLLRLRLSMAAIDSLLSLELVSDSPYILHCT